MPQGRRIIRHPRADELGRLREIEVAAGGLFAAVGMHEISDHEPPPVEVLERYRQAGRAWVATDATDTADCADCDDRPVAYLIADLVDGNAHIEQVSVDPSSSHLGIGRSLIDHTEEWAATQGIQALTLTTFAEVPWNGPYYLRCGFTPLAEADMEPELSERWDEERARGLGHRPRLAMIRRVSPDVQRDG